MVSVHIFPNRIDSGVLHNDSTYSNCLAEPASSLRDSEKTLAGGRSY